MGEGQKAPLRVDFDRGVKLEFHGAKITSETGLLMYRELDDAFDLTTSTANQLADVRTGNNTQHSLTALLRQSIYSRLGGYEDINDEKRLRKDPAMRQVVGGRARERTAASTSEVGRFETEIHSQPSNLRSPHRLIAPVSQ